MAELMRCLSLHQPWASLVAIGAKSIETRSWSTPHRGLLAIHAAKNIDSLDLVDDAAFARPLIAAGYPTYQRYGTALVTKSSIERGAIVAVGRLVNVLPTDRVAFVGLPGNFPTSDKTYLATSWEEDFGDYSPGRSAWVFADLVRLTEPIPLRGQQGLWWLDPDVSERLAELYQAVVRS